jgi:hypothetical protein
MRCVLLMKIDCSRARWRIAANVVVAVAAFRFQLGAQIHFSTRRRTGSPRCVIY